MESKHGMGVCKLLAAGSCRSASPQSYPLRHQTCKCASQQEHAHCDCGGPCVRYGAGDSAPLRVQYTWLQCPTVTQAS
eukprot:2355968-Rhodomonas_salina.1